MVVRCFARRALVTVRRQGHQHLSTSSLSRQEEIEHARSGTTIRQEKELKPGFFSSTNMISKAFAMQTREVKWEDNTSSRSPTTSHPLVNELLSELNNEESTSSPHRIWNLYHALLQQASSSDGSTSSQPMITLTARDHQAVLRAISRKPKRQDKRESKEPALVSYRYQGALLSGSRKAPSHVSSYLQKVLFIFSQLKQSDRAMLPSVVDYDTVLERLAPGGNMHALTALWAHLTGSTAEDFSVGKLGSASQDGETRYRPSPRTYLHMMMGISRHLSAQIERIHKQSISEDIWKGQGRKRQRKEKASALAASKGQAKYGQEVTPQARRAVRLASARTVSLLQDMIRRRIKPEKITVDLAMRMLRMDGNMEGIKVLMKAFGIDLENPDADPRMQVSGDETTRLTTDVHTLNTILMALGEQGTVSEMITAYETLTRPLAIKRVDLEGEDKVQGSLFATDWRGIFQKGEESVQAVEGEDGKVTEEPASPNVAQYEHPLAILPNTTTLSVMIRHCCNAPDPARMVAGVQKIKSKEAQVKQEDHEARQQGDYLNVACYALSEAIEVQERETIRMANQIGLGMPSVPALAVKVEKMLQQFEGGSGTPAKMDKEGFFAKVIEESKETASSLQLPDDFVPHFRPPALGVSYDMIQPIVKHVSRRRTADFARWRWLLAQTQRVIAIKIAELQVIHQATEKWEEVRLAAEYGPHLSNEALKQLLAALRRQRKMIRTEILQLGTSMIERMMERFAALRALRRRRKSERVARHEQEREQLLQSKTVEEQKKERVAWQRQEQAEDNAQALQQESIEIPAVEPAYR